MAQITKSVDKTEVNGSEVFIYTINAAYSGLTISNQEGSITDFIPSKIKYILPPIGGQIEEITEEAVEGGTKLTFHLGDVNSGTSLSFTVACYFGFGRVDNDSFTNEVSLFANDEVVATTAAPTVNLKLKEGFLLSKFAEPSNVLNAGDEVTFTLSLANNKDFGATIENVVITDTLPPELTPIATFIPVGNDIPSKGFSDESANGLTGSWNDNTMTFNLPKYNGARYDITFKAKVSEEVTVGQIFENIGKWTMNDVARNDAVLSLSIYDPNYAGFELFKYGSRTTLVGAPLEYRIINRNIGNVALSNYELEDIIPPEIDFTAFYLDASTGLINYSIYVALASNPSVYIPVVMNVEYGSYPYTNLVPYIPAGDRLARIKLIAQNLLVSNSRHSLFIFGTTNSTAVMGGSFTNEVVAKSGEIIQTNSWKTIVNGASDLSVQKKITPKKQSYNPLDELYVTLSANTINTICVNPILADLMPKGLRYIENSEYFTYYEHATGITYDSRQSGFPVPIPTREVIPNFSETENTLLRWSFEDFILPTSCDFKIIFKAIIEIDAPDSFVNKGYMGIIGDNLFAVYDEVIDTLDIDGDGSTTDRISCKEVSGVILRTSEFMLKKLVKGQKDLDYSSSGFTTAGGDINFQLQVTNSQPMDLKNIEVVDIFSYIGDTGVILTNEQRGSQFDIYETSAVNAEIINIIGEPVDPNPEIFIEYSTSSDPKRFNELGNEIGTGEWTTTPPSDITKVRSIKITTDPTVILRPYDRLIIDLHTKAPVGTPVNKIAYNSYAVRADKIIGENTEPLLPTEPNKVEVTIAGNKRGNIGDFVWFDTNKNGLLDEGELGVNGVTVELYDEDKNLVKSTVTTNDYNGNSGYYLFSDIVDGIYQVKFIAPENYSLTQQQAGQENGSKPNKSTGFTNFITMSNGQHFSDIDAGLIENSCSPKQEITDIIESVALEQTALSHILNAEGEKIQKAVELNLSSDKLLEINTSVNDMVNAITKLEIALKEKLQLFKDLSCGNDCCDDKLKEKSKSL